MKVVILCGGQGTRLKEETEFKPKPMVTIGKHPILWHIMKLYHHHNHNEFIMALGYKGEMIKEYFMHYRWHSSDLTLSLKDRKIEYHDFDGIEDWHITLADTGQDSMTDRRLFLLKRYLQDNEDFLLTYGDGIADVDVNALIRFHKQKGKIITLTGINPKSQYGVIDTDSNGIAKEFKEKPASKDIINGGFMVINKKIFDYLDENDNEMFEYNQIPKLSKIGEVAIYEHKGFWQCMDTYRDYLKLNKMWDSNETPWTVWNK